MTPVRFVVQFKSYRVFGNLDITFQSFAHQPGELGIIRVRFASKDSKKTHGPIKGYTHFKLGPATN